MPYRGWWRSIETGSRTARRRFYRHGCHHRIGNFRISGWRRRKCSFCRSLLGYLVLVSREIVIDIFWTGWVVLHTVEHRFSALAIKTLKITTVRFCLGGIKNCIQAWTVHDVIRSCFTFSSFWPFFFCPHFDSPATGVVSRLHYSLFASLKLERLSRNQVGRVGWTDGPI